MTIKKYSNFNFEKALFFYSLAMFKKLAEFQKGFNNHRIQFPIPCQDFTCYFYKEISQMDYLQNLLKNSEIIIIDNVGEYNDKFYIIFIDKAIIFIKDCDIKLFLNLILNLKNNSIISTSKIVKEETLSYEPQLSFSDASNENDITIQSFSKKILEGCNGRMNDIEICKLILPSFSAYFINKSYKKLEENKISKAKIEINELKDDEYIYLHPLGQSGSSKVDLIYHIKLGQLFALKWFYGPESEKLFQRELKNYERICHPSLPRFYGKITKGGNPCLIIEYIRGKTLEKVDTKNLALREKINFIFQIMFIIEYLQNEFLIYRDLKPNNFIVDEVKRVILIDFDRMIGLDEQKNPEEESTKDFGNIYSAPEVRYGTIKKNYTYSEDVYSLGLLIYYFFFGKIHKSIEEEKSKPIFNQFNDISDKYIKLREICAWCTHEDPLKRPKITKLIDDFYDIVLKFMQIEADCFDLIEVTSNYNQDKYFPYWTLFFEYNNCDFQEQLKMLYSNENINSNIRKYIQKYSEYLNINHLISQFSLGIEYYPESYFNKNNNKIIHFFFNTENTDNSKLLL